MKFIYLSSIIGIQLFSTQASAAPLHCFGEINAKTTIEVLIARCGPPDNEGGFGLYICTWKFPDGSLLSASGTGQSAPILSARQVMPDGKVLILYAKPEGKDQGGKP